VTPAAVHDRIAVIRPIAATDGASLDRFHEGLSDETTRMRFFVLHPHLTPSEVDRFVHVDHHDREALVAIADDEIVGVGRFERLADSNDAEVAFVVTDMWQGRGVGTSLFTALVERARSEGVERLVAETLGDNHRMLAVFHHAGHVVESSIEAGVIRVVLDVRTEAA
jgi:RimJ/RimL family protein N-acetyltransferase